MLNIIQTITCLILTIGLLAGAVVYSLLGKWPKRVNEIDLTTDYQIQVRPIINIAAYVTIFYGGASIVSALLISIYCVKNGIEREVISSTSPLYDPAVAEQLQNDLNPYLQIIVYGLALIAITIISLPYFKLDAKAFKPKYLLYSLMGIGLIFAANIIGNIILLIVGVSGDSSNQESLIKIMLSSPTGFVLTFVTTVILAPIVEEFVFRKSIFSIFKGNQKVAWIVSSICFGALHIISPAIIALQGIFTGDATFNDFAIELVYLLPYSLMGLALGFVYIKSNRNIYTTIITHAINNFISVVAVLLQYILNELIQQFQI